MILCNGYGWASLSCPDFNAVVVNWKNIDIDQIVENRLWKEFWDWFDTYCHRCIQRATQRLEPSPKMGHSNSTQNPNLSTTNSTLPVQSTPLVTDSPPNPRTLFSPRRKTSNTPKLNKVFTLKTSTMRTKTKQKGKKKWPATLLLYDPTRPPARQSKS